MAKKKQNFEDAMRRLEEIVSALSDGNLPLDDMMKLYEEWRALSRTCLAQLEAYEGRLEAVEPVGGEMDAEEE